MTAAAALERLDKSKTRRVKLGVTDIDGILRGKYISLEKFASAAEGGLGFCDVIFGWDIGDVLYDNGKFTGWHTGYPDLQARIDFDTLRFIPWEEGTAFFLVDLPSPSPRQVLRAVLDRADALGYTSYLSAEYEFWFFRETPHSLRDKHFRDLTTLTPGMYGYSVLRASENSDLVLDILDKLTAFDIPIEGFHTETGPGVYEAAIAVDAGLRAADKAALFKTAVKEIGARHGVMPTFMAKWNAEMPGSSGHIHQSLWSGENNLFVNEPALMNRYLAGLTAYLPDLMAMICPTVNSYKRTVPGTWAPVNASWGKDNRTTAVRAILGGAKSTRIELRLSGADMNPYLAMAASIAAGLEGIERELVPTAPVMNAYQAADAVALPRNLADANRIFQASPMARRWFGDGFVDHYAATRDWEVRQYEKAVTDWELARYFEAI